MKKTTLLKMLLFIMAFWNVPVNAQNKDAATYFAKFITAQKYRLGDKLPRDTVKALRLYTDCAENGKMPLAMNQLGLMYQTGKGVNKDTSKAFYWFSKSVEKGDPTGMFYLGSMYKTGEGVTINYSKAFSYFKASAEKGFYQGMYGAGYCSFKGLGTAQSYDEAVKWFRKGIEKNCPACTYMLGICYRNGFGVEQNEPEATKLLQKASGKKLDVANKELQKEYPEIAGKEPLRGNNGGNGKGNSNDTRQTEKFIKLIKSQNNVPLDGTWAGTRYLFDWSGQHILHQAELLVTLSQNGNHIKGQWIEGGELVVKFEGIVIDGQIVFNGSKFNGKNRYGQPVPMEFKFARFEAINADVNYLAGNIESYSPQTKEPGYPCYVVMQKLQEKSAAIDTIKMANLNLEKIVPTGSTKIEDIQEPIIAEQVTAPTAEPVIKQVETAAMKNEALDYFKRKDAMMTVFPNPFKNEINVTYQVNTESKARLFIYNAAGSMVLQKDLGVKQQGTYLEVVRLEAVPGQYIVRLVIGDDAYAKIIIKQ